VGHLLKERSAHIDDQGFVVVGRSSARPPAASRPHTPSRAPATSRPPSKGRS
jgi:hypothetical protein